MLWPVLVLSSVVAMGHQADSTTVAGRVVSPVGRPVSFATVTMTTQARSARVIADADGRFVFRDVPPGPIAIDADKVGWLRGTAKLQVERAISAPAITVVMRAFGSISGIVQDEFGDPVPSALVTAWERATVAGRSVLQAAGTSTTDDRGAFTLSVIPGEFLVSVSSDYSILRRTSPAEAPVRLRYARSFAPAASTPADAVWLKVEASEALEDVSLRMSLVAGEEVSGIVTSAAGPEGGVSIALTPVYGDRLMPPPKVATTETRADGKFTLDGIPAGEYRLAAGRATSGGTQGSAVESASVTLTVPPGGLSDVVVSMAGGARISGIVRFDGLRPPPRPQEVARIHVRLEPADGHGDVVPNSVTVDPKARFRIGPVQPGRYVVRVTSAPPGWFFKTARLHDRDVADAPMSLTVDVGGVEIVFGDRPSILVGRVSGGGGDRHESSVLLFPADPGLWTGFGRQGRRFQAARTTEGRYEFGNVPAGEYLAVALPQAPESWRHEDVLRQLEPAGTRVTVEDGARATLPLRLASIPVSASDSRIGDRVTADPSQPTVSGVGRQPRLTPLVPAFVTGTVVDDASKPIGGAVVVLRGPTLHGELRAISDLSGRFRFFGLPAGEYRLGVTKPAYIATEYGETTTGGLSASVKVPADATIDLNVRLRAAGVIDGRVLGPDGQPLRDAHVRLFERRTSGQTSEFVPAATGHGTRATDAFGHYRLFGVAPGQYVVGAEARLSVQDLEAPLASSSASGVSRRFGLQPSFYPGTPDVVGAQVLSLSAGSVQSGVDIQMALVELTDVTGRIIGDPVGAGALPRLAVTGLTPAPPGMRIDPFIRVVPGGDFSVNGLYPGRYRLVAEAKGNGGLNYWASNEVVASGTEITSVLALQPAAIVTGRVRVDDETARTVPPRTIRIDLIPMPGESGRGGMPVSAPVDPGWRFTFNGVVAGVYRVAVVPAGAALPVPLVVQSVTEGGRDITASGLEVHIERASTAREIVVVLVRVR
jgi:protocatechuate 3,4-dioxygenase beta subunit